MATEPTCYAMALAAAVRSRSEVVCLGCGVVTTRSSDRRNLNSSSSAHVLPLWKATIASQLNQLADSVSLECFLGGVDPRFCAALPTMVLSRASSQSPDAIASARSRHARLRPHYVITTTFFVTALQSAWFCCRGTDTTRVNLLRLHE